MIKNISLLITIMVLVSYHVKAQNFHTLEAPKKHYKRLQILSTEPNSERSHLDEIKYPSNQYNSGSLTYLMVLPEYLSKAQLEDLKMSIEPPANSSEQTKAELEFLLAWQNKRTKAQEDRASVALARIGYWPHIALLKSHSRYRSNLAHLFLLDTRYWASNVSLKIIPPPLNY